MSSCAKASARITALSAEAVTVTVGRRETAKDLVRAVSLAIHPGEVLALVGPNGAGKSTLLAVLSGGLKPTSGTVTIDGAPLFDLVLEDPLALARRRAVLPQAEALGFPLTVLEVVLLGRHPHLLGALGRERPQDLAIAWHALRRVNAEHLATRAFPTLSGGERQRVRIARALAQIAPTPSPTPPSARYLLLDEPAAGLDLAHARALHVLLRAEASSAETGIVVVEHDLALAATADRIAVLADGRLVALGPPREVLTPALLAQFFGLAGGLICLPSGGLALDLPPLATLTPTPIPTSGAPR